MPDRIDGGPKMSDTNAELLNQQETQMRDFLDNASDPVHMTDGAGRFTYVNNAWLRLFGYTREEVEQLTVYDVLHPSDHKFRDELVGSPANFQQPYKVEIKFLTKEKRMLYIEAFLHTKWKDGAFAGTQTILTDVTARRELNEAIKESRDKLQAANVELERAVRVKDEFLANMSHELRTPLTAIIGLSEVLVDGAFGALSPEQKDTVRSIEGSGRHLLALINDILDLSKLEARQVELDIEECAVADVTHASLQFIKGIAEKKNIEIAQAIEPAEMSIRADCRRLKQMLVNLLSNAVKFTPSGGRVGLTVKGSQNAKWIEFTVWDTGIGIKEEDLPKLFKPFSQIDNALARHYEGTGLGLVLVQRGAHLHGGEVSVKSKPGEGSQFTIHLPWKGA
jgi:PAS domain S-box-containing protein